MYDRLIMPFWIKYKGKPGFTCLQKIGLGLVLSVIGMAAAAIVEKKRLSVASSLPNAPPTLPISVFLLIPQFFLVGAGEPSSTPASLTLHHAIPKRHENHEHWHISKHSIPRILSQQLLSLRR
ncbi:unnamed protein product [Rhodiola kirilowii]